MFFGPIKSAVSAVGSSGLGAFTPSTASGGALAWSAVPAAVGQHLVRAEEGSTWELFYSWWDATTLSRSATQFVDSSTGSPVTFTTAATVCLVEDPRCVQAHMGTVNWGIWDAGFNQTNPQVVGMPAITANGTATSASWGTSSLIATQQRVLYASATTANAIGGPSATNDVTMRHTTAGWGGFDVGARFGATTLPATPRLLVGLSAAAITTVEPSTLFNVAAFAKDSGDTNIQFMTNDGSGACTKGDTGIALATAGVYKCHLWCPPGGAYVEGLIVRLDTGAIWFERRTTNLPASGTGLKPMCVGALVGTTGTAFAMQFCYLYVKQGW